MKVFFIVNVARRQKGPDPRVLADITALLRERGIEFRMEYSHSIEQCRSVLDEAVRDGFDSLWIGGGDGTINHVLNSTLGRFDTYAIVPLGTINGLARALGMPRDPVEAVRWILDGEPTGMELVRVGDRYFVLYATIGFHAAVFHGINPGLKRLIGKGAFYAAGAREVCRASGLPRFDVELHTIGSVHETGDEAVTPGGQEQVEEPVVTADASPHRSEIHTLHRSAYSLVISNFLNFSGFGAVREGDIGDSSFLVTHLFPSCSLWPMLRFFATVRYRRPREDDPGVEHHRVSEVVVRSSEPLWLQVDGEPVHIGDDREFRFVCIPNAIRILWNRNALMGQTK